MLRKWNRFLAFLLAVALIATTFHSDLASIRVFAEGEDTVETPADPPAQTEEPAVEPESDPNPEPAGEPAEPETTYEEPAPADTPAPADDPNPGNEDPANVEPETPQTPPADTAVDEATAGITDPAELPEDGDGTAKENEADDAATLASSIEEEIEDDAAALGSSEEEEKEEKELEEKLVTVTYSAQLGGRVSKASETIDINDKNAKFEGSTASAVNKYYQFMAWVDKNGNTVSTESTFVPSDVEEDTSFTATFEKLSNMPAQDFTGSAGGMNVSVSADDGIFPEGTTMSVTAISDGEAIEAATDALGENVKEAKGVDITFRNADGDEIEPADSKYVHVTISLASALEGEEFKVVHKDDSGNAAEIAGASAGGADFDANSFSVYILAGLQPDAYVATYKFLAYNFETDSWETFSEQFVKNGESLYNPNTPTLGDHQVFFGWFYEDGTQLTDFGTVEVTETKEIIVKAKVEITYYVTLIGLDGETVQVYDATVINDQPATVKLNSTVEVQEAEQAFVGWKNSEGTIYPNGSVIDATDSRNETLTAAVANAYWIRFDANDGGTGTASFTEPIYVTAATGYKATKPANPTRSGYTFVDWYKDSGCTQKFDWTKAVTGNITLYAKWNVGKASFTIITWKQKSTDAVNEAEKHYDYDSSMVVSGYTVGASITNPMLGNTINRTITGFTYAGNDAEGKTINGEGSTVVNVYYDRKVVTLKFLVQENGHWVGYGENSEMKGLYESTLEANGYTWPSEKEWREDTPTGTRMTFLTAFLYDGGTKTFYGKNNENTGFHYYHFKQNPDGETYPSELSEAADTAEKTYSKDFNFTDKYTGFSVCGYIDEKHATMQTVKAGNSKTVYGNTYVYHKRNKYTFTLVHVKYGVDPVTGQPIESAMTTVGTYSLFYEAPLSEAQSDVVNAANALTAPDGYNKKEVGGNSIFADPAGNQPVNWAETMPASNDIRLYVVWIRDSFTVNLDVNWDGDNDISTTVEGQTAGMDTTQTKYYGSTLSRDDMMNKFTRPGYELIGWFNDDGSPYGYGYINADITLHAQWRRVGIVKVNYDAGEGVLPEEYKDNTDYAGDSFVIATSAPTPPENKIFAGWELLDKNGQVVALYYPGSSFQITDNNIVADTETLGHVNLRAKYDPAGLSDDELYTTITYHPNGGSGDITQISELNGHRLRINEAVAAWTEAEAKARFTRAGYELIGWNTDKAGADNQVVTIGFGATYIIADNENNPGNSNQNILYAVWKPGVNVKVTIVGRHASKDYTGEAQYVYNYDITKVEYFVNGQPYAEGSGFNPETDVHLKAGEVAQASGTDVGHYVMGLSPDSFVTTNTSFNSVVFDVTDGYLDINPKVINVTITGNHRVETYNGTEFTVTGYEVDSGGLISEDDIKYNGTAEAKRIDVGTTVMGLDASKFSYDKNSNYQVSFTLASDGYMQVDPAEITVYIVGNHNSFTYDGTEHTVTGYDLNPGTTNYSAADFTFNGTAEAKRTEEGTTKMGLVASQFTNTNTNYSKVTFEVTDGYVTIAPIDKVIVTIVGNTVTVDYDGENHTVTGYEVTSISNDLYKESYIGFTGSASASGKAAGTYNMNLADSQFSNNNSNFAEVEFRVTDGKLIINPISVTVKIYGNTGTKVYNGSEQYVEGYRVGEISSDLYTTADFTFSGTAIATGTAVGIYPLTILTTQFTNTNPNFENVTFDITPGQLEITPLAGASVTIIGNKSTLPYDGTEHTVTGYTVSIPAGSLLKESDIKTNGTVSASASRKDVGTTNMGLATSMFRVDNPNFKDVSISVEDGYQNIEPIDVTVTITGHKDSVDYDGEIHSVSGYEVEISNPLYTTADFTFSGPSSVSGTDAGTYPMGLAISQFRNTNTNFGTVTFAITDGELKINKIDVTVTITGHKGEFSYNGTERKVTGYDVSISNPLYTESDFKFSGSSTVKAINAGTYPMELDSSQFSNLNSNFGTVTFSTTNGELKINQITAVVTVTGHNGTFTYDGEPHKVTGKDFDYSTSLYTRTDFRFDGTDTAERTDEGTTWMELDPSQFVNVNKNFSEVTFNVTDGFVTIVPKGKVVVTITGNTKSVDYTGEEQSVTGYTVSISDPLYTEADFTYTGEAIAKGTDAGTYEMAIDKSKFKNINSNFSDVTFNVIQGSLTIRPIAIEIKITGNDDTLTYTGEEQKVEGFTATSENALFDETKVEYAGDAVAKGTDVDTYPMNLDITKFTYEDDNFDGATFSVADGFLMIIPADITVTITGKEDTLEYNGKEQEITGYTPSTTSDIYDLSNVTMTGEAKATGKYVGDYKMNLAEDQFTNNDDNFNVTFVIEDGILHIIDRAEKYIITATTNDVEREYSGEVYSGFGFSVTGGKKVNQEGNAIANIVNFISGILRPIKASADDGTTTDPTVIVDGVKYTVTGLYVDASGRDVGTYPLTIKGSMVVLDEDGQDVTGQFTLEVNEGNLKITKRHITVTSGSATKPYDGNPLTSSVITTDKSWGTGDAVGFNITGSQTEQGTSKNTFTLVPAAGTDLEKNYIVDTVFGDLTVTAAVTPPGTDPTPGDDPTPPTPPTPPTTATPTTPTTIVDAATPLAPTAPVAPVLDAAVLGATRQQSGAAVLGARRAKTEDATNTIPRVFAIIAAAAILAALLASFRRKEEEQ